jgi:hypothetical protein
MGWETAQWPLQAAWRAIHRIRTKDGRKAFGKPHILHGDYRNVRVWRGLRWIIRINGYLLAVLYDHPDPRKTCRARDWLDRHFDRTMFKRLAPKPSNGHS